jgi:hypothetical protein
MIVVVTKYHFFFVLKLLKSTQLPAKSKRLKSQKIAPKSCSNINATATSIVYQFQDDQTVPNEFSQLSNNEQPELTALDRKLKVERLAKSSIMLNFLLDSNNNNGLRLHESKSCGYVKHGHHQQNDEEYVVEEDELLLANNKEWPEEIPDIDDETNQNLLMFNDKQLVTEEQFNQAFILNVSFFLLKFKEMKN